MKTVSNYLIHSIFLLLGVFLFDSCSPAESSKAIPVLNAPIPVKIMEPQKEESTQPIITSGNFSTDDETTLSFKTGGIIEKILVKEGDFVKKGQLLATLDLTEIKSQVNQAELAFEKANRDFTRAENLYKDSVATLEQYQNATTALAVAKQQLNAAKFNLSFSEIRSGANGFVLKKFVNSGQFVAPGASIIRTNGAGNSNWVFKSGVSDKEWSMIQVNDPATIKLDYAPDKPLKATVLRKSEGADPITGSFFIEMKVEMDKDIQIASGLFGTATISPSRKIKVWNIPYDALLDGNANTGFVFVTNDKKTAQKVPVTISSIDGDYVRILNRLPDSSYLIVQGSAYLTHDSPISIVE